jgi:multidrug transporter EmrE-like cation transporter
MGLSLFAFILFSVGLNALAQILLRKGMLEVGEDDPDTAAEYAMAVAFEPWLIGGMACYAVSIVAWLVVLSRAEVSVAYPFLSLGYVIAAALGFFFLGENLTLTRIIGLALLCGGLVFISRSA